MDLVSFPDPPSSRANAGTKGIYAVYMYIRSRVWDETTMDYDQGLSHLCICSSAYNGQPIISLDLLTTVLTAAKE